MDLTVRERTKELKARTGRRFRPPPPNSPPPDDILPPPNRQRPPPPRFQFQNLDITIAGLIKAIYRHMDGITTCGKELLIVAETTLRMLHLRPVHVRPDFIVLLRNVCRDYIRSNECQENINMACKNVLDTLDTQPSKTRPDGILKREKVRDRDRDRVSFQLLTTHNRSPYQTLPPLNQ